MSGYGEEGINSIQFETQEINWDKVGGPAPGRYDVECTKAEPALTKEKKPMAKVQFGITGFHNADNAEEVGKNLFDNFVFTANAAFRVAGFGKAASAELPTTITPDALQQFCESIVGVQITVDVKQELYDGNMQSRITRYHPLGGPTEEPQAAAEEPRRAGGGHAPGSKPQNGRANGHAPGAKTPKTGGAKAQSARR